MNNYQVFNHDNTLLGTFPNAADALKAALIYQHQQKQPTYVEQAPDAPRYEVQQFTLCDGWTNTWTEYDEDNNEQPMTFDSFEAALDELDEHLSDCEKEYERGNIESPYKRDEFRIVQIAP